LGLWGHIIVSIEEKAIVALLEKVPRIATKSSRSVIGIFTVIEG
jgi:hypothetical protein